jgi:hypothetical protein
MLRSINEGKHQVVPCSADLGSENATWSKIHLQDALPAKFRGKRMKLKIKRSNGRSPGHHVTCHLMKVTLVSSFTGGTSTAVSRPTPPTLQPKSGTAPRTPHDITCVSIQKKFDSYASTAGYPTLAIDQLGSGNSSHPDPMSVVQTPSRSFASDYSQCSSWQETSSNRFLW